jgi:hypothetical protein
MKKLTIEHICGYLPYGLKACAIVMAKKRIYDEAETEHTLFYDVTLVSLEKKDAFAESSDPSTIHGMWMNANGIKPILVPLDKLTDAQYAEVGAFIIGEGYADFTRCKAGRFFCKNNGHGYSIDIQDVISITSYLHSIFADVHNLIPAGLAISAYDLPENPYGKEV